jgi:hypothetical protein
VPLLQAAGKNINNRILNRMEGSMYKKIAALTVLILILCVHITFAAPNIKEGNWEITVKMEMPGMPMEMPAVQFTQCLSSQNTIPVNKDELKDCKILSSSIDGNTAKWVMQCTQGGEKIQSRGTITYKGDTFDGVVKISMKGMDITQKMKGRREGKCE